MARTVTFKIEGIPQLEAALKRAATQGAQAIASGLFDEAETVLTKSKQNHVPVDEGILRASAVTLPPKIRPGSVQVDFGFGGAASNYAVIMHEGRRPGGRMPPLQPIRDWARRHGIDEDAAYLIARSIARKGTKPLKYLETPLLEAVPGMGRRLAAHVSGRIGG